MADYLIARGRSPEREHLGWGLGKPMANAINRANATPPCAAETCYTYTSCYAALALLQCHEVTGRTDCLEAAISWRRTLLEQVGMHPELGHVYYSDSLLHKAPNVYTWIPNVTATSIGFLTRLAAVTGDTGDRELIERLGSLFLGRMANGNWAYDNEAVEDPFHLGMILEGLWLGREFVPFDPAPCVAAIIESQFAGGNVREAGRSLGTQGWALAMTLLALHRYGLGRRYVETGLEHLRTHPELAFGNIRTSGMYARLLAELEAGGE